MPEPTPQNRPKADPPRPGEGVVDALAEFQARLDHLKKISANRNEDLAKIRDREKSLEQREADVAAALLRLREAETLQEQARKSIVSDRESLDALGKQLGSARESLDRQRAEVEARANQLDQQVQELRARGEELERKRKELEADRERLSREVAALEQRTAQSAAALAELEAQRAEQAQKLVELAKREAGVSAAEQEAARRKNDLAIAESTIEARLRAQAAREDELNRQAAELQREGEELTARETSVLEAERKLNQSKQEAQAAWDAAQKELAGLEAALRTKQQEFDQRVQTLEAQERALQERHRELANAQDRLRVDREALDAQRLQIETRDNELRIRAADVASREEALGFGEGDAGKFRAKIQELASERERLSQERDRLSQERERLAEERDRLTQELVRAQEERRAGEQALQASEARTRELEPAQAALNQARGEVERLRQELEHAHAKGKGRGKHDTEELAQLQRTLRAKQDALAEAETQLKEAKEQLAQQRHESEAESQQLTTVLQQLKERLKAEATARREAAAELARLKAERPGETSAPAPVTSREALEAALPPMRLHRLSRYRELRKNKSVKIRRAEAALSRKFEICEQVLAQRAELAETHRVVLELKRRAEGAKARSRAGALTCFVVATLGIVAALSWAIAGQVSPGRFAATSEIRASSRAGQMSDEQLAEWQRFHEALVLDPSFISEAAEHMARKGLAELGSPGLLKARLEADLSWESAQDGQLKFELKGNGRERTERELNALVTRLASEANAARDRRLDGGVTDISQPSKAGDHPIDDRRLTAAAFIAGCAASVSFMVGVFSWRRLVAIKAKHDMNEHIEAVLDSSRWPEMERATKAMVTQPENERRAA
ncbi:MAG: hypothetical protein SFZ23_03915 [Planctomycetota bacterium]|nr:hypothetical protein [Planctomycetota bacterium]